MKTYCSFMGFQEELSPSHSGIKEDQGGVVTPQALVRLKGELFLYAQSCHKGSQHIYFPLEACFHKGYLDCSKIKIFHESFTETLCTTE